MKNRNELKSFFTQYWEYMVVSTACKLHIFDHLQSEKTAGELAKELSLNKGKTSLLLDALHHAGFLDKEAGLFKINATSELLTEDHPESLKYACMNWSAEHLNAWQNLDYSIKTGGSSFEKIYGKPFFDFLDDHPEKLHAYHRAMYQYAKDDYKKLPSVVDFSKHNSLMDVGGGYGAALEKIKAKNTAVECILFDLEKVIEQIDTPLIMKVSGNFLKDIPPIMDGIILSRILHDWNNEKAIIILKNCFKALPNEGVLYVIENCSDKIKNDLSLLSLNMAAICNSFERSSLQYISLCQKVGFKFKSEAKLNDLQTILIFKK